jgi:hypothetical protein
VNETHSLRCYHLLSVPHRDQSGASSYLLYVISPRTSIPARMCIPAGATAFHPYAYSLDIQHASVLTPGVLEVTLSHLVA